MKGATIGKMKGPIEMFEGSGQWNMPHALSSFTGKYVIIKLR